jgi:uncharacterized protein DUF2188
MPRESKDKERTVYHVAPDGAAERWVIFQENGDFRREFDRKEDAVDVAKLKAKLDQVSQVTVHARNGDVEYESTYGEDRGISD